MFINAILMIAGTAIGAGLIALPLSFATVGTGPCCLVILAMAAVSYYTACVTIDLNNRVGHGTSIITLSSLLSGPRTRWITSISFNLLSFALLTAYMNIVTDSLQAFFHVENSFVILFLCSLAFYGCLRLSILSLYRVNSSLCVALFICLFSVLYIMWIRTENFMLPTQGLGNLPHILAILFTSFGVQNICPNVYDLLQGDIKRIKRAFLIGIGIPSFFYIIWIESILNYLKAHEGSFFQAISQGTITPGVLVQKLCDVLQIPELSFIFKGIALLAIGTSAIGIGLGLLVSLREQMAVRKATILLIMIPLLLNLICPNVFLRILSFGGAMAVIFVIFVPIYLKTMYEKINVRDGICLCLGIFIIALECNIFP